MSSNDTASRRKLISKRRAGLPEEEQALLDKWLQGAVSTEDEFSQSTEQNSSTSISGQWSITSLQEQIASELNPIKIHPLPSLVPMQVNDLDKSPFFLVHPGGGDVTDYAKLIHYLGSDRSFYGLRAQGIDGLQSPHTQIETMASYYIDLLHGVQSEGPYLLGGWSMGGVVAFEMARQLHTQGQEIAQLILIDSYRPQAKKGIMLQQVDPVINFALSLGLSLRQIKPHYGQLESLSFHEKLNVVLEEVRRANLFSSETTLAHIWYRFRVFISNLQAIENYVPFAYTGSLTLFKASKQFGDVDYDLGWRELITGNLTLHTVSGDHHTIIREPNVKALAQKIGLCLQAQRRN